MLAAGLAALAATAAFAVTGPHGVPDAPRAQAFAAGAVAMSNSREARAIFSASNFAPGESVTGTVTITNTGTAAGSLELTPAVPRTSGTNGPGLIDALRLRIDDVSEGAQDPLYDGGLAELPALALSTMNAGDARTLRFSAILPDGGVSADDAGDNLLQRSSMSVGYSWTLTQTEPVPEPEPEPPGAEPPSVAPPSATPRPPATPPTAKPPGGVRPKVVSRRGPCRRRIAGTARADRLTGTAGGDLIYGRGGADRLSGLGGVDCIWGGDGKDRLQGGTGADQLHGGTDDDVLTGDAGRDRIIAGFGDDLIHARDGEPDVVDCGPGRDRAVVDRGDRVHGCERVLRPAPRR